MPLNILLIDENLAESTLVNTTLSREGYVVTTTHSLEDGHAALNDHGCDMLLLSDTVEQNALAGWWKETEEKLKAIPIVLLGTTDKGTVPLREALPTPIDTQALVRAVRTHLGPAEPSPSLSWLPDSLKEGSEEIVEMERMLGWAEGDEDDEDPVNLGIFTEEEATTLPPNAPEAPDGDALGDTLTTRIESIDGDDKAPRAAAQPTTPAPESAPAVPIDFGGLPPERVEEIVTGIAREVVERVVWETVPHMVAKVLSESRAEQDKLFSRIVERVVWETVPTIAERGVTSEIQRLSEPGES
ncbi:MAG: hypothetical protein ACE5FN_04710 [Leptospirillia bacterium]